MRISSTTQCRNRATQYVFYSPLQVVQSNYPVHVLILLRGNEAGVLAASLLLIDMLVQPLKQPVDLREQVAVVERQRDKKKRKGDMLPPEFAEHVAHREGHGGKTMALWRRLLARRRTPLRRCQIAARKHEIPVLPPLDVNTRWPGLVG